MPVIPTLPAFGVVPSPATTYPIRTVAGVDVVDLPGRLFVMGGPVDTDAPAHWVQVSGFSMGRTPVTAGLYNTIDGTREVAEGRQSHPMVEVSALEGDRFIVEFNKRHGTQFGSPTEAEWEYAARGGEVNLRERMEGEGIKVADFVDWAKGRFENFFAHCLGSTIYGDPAGDDFQRVLKSAATVYGYCVYGHPEGLDGEKVWYNKGGITSVTDEAAVKRASRSGLIDLIGNVWEWVADRYDENAYHTLSPIDPVSMTGENRVYRGGSGFNSNPDLMRAVCRLNGHPDYRDIVLGFRLALPASQAS